VILHSHERLDIKRQEAVFALARTATDSDGFNPLSEHVALHLRAGGDEADSHFTLTDNVGVLIGYAHLDQTDLIAGPSAELVIAPSARRSGGGRMLTNELVRVAGPRLRLWSHGDLPESEALASALGFVRIREVIQLRRSLELPLPKFQIPESIQINQFDEASDSKEWLSLNARAFAHHPEQRNWTAEDLALRLKEPWFDPAGFLLACRKDRKDSCVAFCWTKVHGETDVDHGHSHQMGDGHKHGHDPIGEIYVIGVDPAEQGAGLGRLMTLAGMSYLKSLGLRTVMLYVEGDNEPAKHLYANLGYQPWGTDVMYRLRSVQPPDASI
jgi:mycothiol synthase